MKTLYLKTTMKMLKLLPALIFFMLALSYTASSQTVLKTPLCYGEPITLLCNYTQGCNADPETVTFHWQNTSGSWSSTERDPVIHVGETGYATDHFYLSIQFDPPPSFFGGRVFVEVLDQIFITGNTTPAICFGTNTGTATINVTGGQPLYGFSWSNGATTQNLTNLHSGGYTVTVTDMYNCAQTSSTFVVGESSTQLTFTNSITPANCNGSSDGSVSVTASGGQFPYSYAWSVPGTTNQISNLLKGTYSVTVSDFNACTSTGSFYVDQPTAVGITSSKTDPKCNASNDGTITVTASGGSPGYTYSWSNSATTGAVITSLPGGGYTVTVSDTHGCKATASWLLTAPAELTAPGTVTTVSCNGKNDGAINITPAGGTTPYFFAWSNNKTDEDISGLLAGSYTVTISDFNSCEKSFNYTVGQPAPILYEGVPTDAKCNLSCDGSIALSVNIGAAPYTYMWSNGLTTEDISGLCKGTYTVTITAAPGCFVSDSWTVGSPALLAVTGTHTNALCKGSLNGTITTTVTGGTSPYGYLWTNAKTTDNVTGLRSGGYTVTVTDLNGCTASNSWFIEEPGEISWQATTTNASCKDVCDGTITTQFTSGGAGEPYFYRWNDGTTTKDRVDLCDGTYYITISDINSCYAKTDRSITEPALLEMGTVYATNVNCNGAANGFISGGTTAPPYVPITITGGTGPYAFEWSTGATTTSLCCLGPGCYSVTVTDAHGCTVSDSWCLTEPSAISIDGNVTDVLCHGASTGAIDITVSGGIALPDYQSYIWSNNATTADISGLIAGVYTVTVRDMNGCPQSRSWEVFEPTLLQIDHNALVTDVLCNGVNIGAIDISVSGGVEPYKYAWSNFKTTQDLTDLSGGWYTVTVTDANTCEDSYSWFVDEPSALSLVGSVTSISCYGYTNGSIDVTATGGSSPYGYAWSNGKTTNLISGLLGGWYTVTVTDAHSCDITRSYEVLQPDPWAVHVNTEVTTVCCNSEIDVSYWADVTGELGFLPGTQTRCTDADITYEWVVVGGTITHGWNEDHILVDWNCCNVGTVTVTATKCDGCQVSDMTSINVIPAPAPEIVGAVTVFSGTNELYCVEPAITGHLYSWTVIGGTYTTVPGSECITVTWGAYPECGCGKVIVCETDPITGCVGCDTLYITMLPTASAITISGTVAYNNMAPVPSIALNGVTVQLRNKATNSIIATTVTGPNMNGNGEPGYYAFTNVPAGVYKLTSSFNGTWGGNNATDALLVQLQAALETGPMAGWILQGLYHTAGDVNASGSVTALDALYIKLRTVGSISSYPAGNWTFDIPEVTIAAVPVAVVVNFYGLCVGDVNGSYIPTGMKDVTFLSVVDNETQTVPVEETFAYEIRSNMVAQLGAMTLYMGYDKDRFEVMDVTASSNDEMKYVIEDGKVAIAWADTKPMSVRSNDQILTLNVKAKAPMAEATSIFSVLSGSEFANQTGTRYDNFDLKMSKVITAGGSKEFSITNYPNPFSDNTKIVYSIPESCKVTLVITDMFGKTVRTLVDGAQNAGTYSIAVNAAELNLTSGVYLYRIEAAGTTETYVKVNKMVFTR